MNKVLEFIFWYMWYLIMGFIGVWIGSLIVGADVNPLTSWLPYVIALAMSLSEYIFK